MQSVDVAVIGTGQGGVPLAIDLAGSGKRIVVFERSAHGAGRAWRAADIGVHADVRVDFSAVMERVRATVADWNGGVEAKFAKHPEIALLRAEASFTGPHTLEAGGDRYEAATIVVDTGTCPAVPKIEGIDEPTRTRADRILGYAVFTDPQVGRVGLPHEAALKAGHDVRCVTLELENVARAIEWNETNGFYRMVVDTKDQRDSRRHARRL